MECERVMEIARLNQYLFDTVYTIRIDIRDISMFGKVHSLNLYKCVNLTDVSELGGVHTHTHTIE